MRGLLPHLAGTLLATVLSVGGLARPEGVGSAAVEPGLRAGNVVIGSFLDVSKTPVTITGFMCQWGNHMVSVIHALVYAEAIGQYRVILPKVDGIWSEFFDLPKGGIAIQPNTPEAREMAKRVTCARSYQGDFFSGNVCKGVAHRDYRRVVRQYLKPLLTEGMRNACEAERKDDFDGLTVHLRSGDLLGGNSNHQQARFPPCSFIDKVVSDHAFRRIRIITQPDMNHVCINATRARHGDVLVQSSSAVKDACALMMARHLLIMDSTFAKALELLSDRTEDVYSTSLHYGGGWQDYHVGDAHDPFGMLGDCTEGKRPELGVTQLGQRGRRQYFFHSFPAERDRHFESEEKRRLLLSTPASQISLLRVCRE